MIGHMVGDVLVETERRVSEAGLETIEDVRAAGAALVGFSSETAVGERALKALLYEHVYGARQLVAIRKEAQRVVSRLASAYRADPSLLPVAWQSSGDEVERVRTVGDFIAGMTDRFAIARHEELLGPVNLPRDRF
jgi:dGTPase